MLSAQSRHLFFLYVFTNMTENKDIEQCHSKLQKFCYTVLNSIIMVELLELVY